jgi:hypothetical protein
LEISFS